MNSFVSICQMNQGWLEAVSCQKKFYWVAIGQFNQDKVGKN